MSFYKSIATVGGLTLCSRILGFGRDILTANYLGAGPMADAFFVALKLPNFFRRITGEGAFSVSFVPLFAGELEKEGEEKAKEFAREAQAFMLSVLIPFTVLAILAMPWILYVIAPGFGDTPDRYELAVQMSRVTFPYILFMSLTALLGGVMNSYDRFGPFAAAPILFNLSLIVAMVLFADFAGGAGYAMAWGVTVAGVLQLSWLLYSCRKIGVTLYPQRPKVTPRIKRLFKNMVPGIFGAGVAQINLFVDMILASLLPVGSISFLYYADRMYQLPLGVIGIAIGTALLPTLTRAIKADDGVASRKLFVQGFEVALVLSLPATFAYLVVGTDIMQVLFARGAFSVEQSHAAAYALMGYALGLPAFVLARVMSAAFYAREDTKTPVKFAIICAIANTALALCLIWPFKHIGIATATGLTAWINIVLLVRALGKRDFFSFDKAELRRIAEIMTCTLSMSAVLLAMHFLVMPHFLYSGQVLGFVGLALMLLFGGLTYAVALYFVGILRPEYIKALFPKGKKQDTINDVQNFGQ